MILKNEDLQKWFVKIGNRLLLMPAIINSWIKISFYLEQLRVLPDVQACVIYLWFFVQLRSNFRQKSIFYLIIYSFQCKKRSLCCNL